MAQPNKTDIAGIIDRTVDSVIKRLPCERNEKMLINHERILKNGLQQAVMQLNKNVQELIGQKRKENELLIQAYQEKEQAQKNERRRFVRGLAVGILVSAVSVGFGLLTKYL